MKRGAKRMNIRHGHGPRRGCNAVEKAIETATRREGKRLTLTGREVDEEYQPPLQNIPTRRGP